MSVHPRAAIHHGAELTSKSTGRNGERLEVCADEPSFQKQLRHLLALASVAVAVAGVAAPLPASVSLGSAAGVSWALTSASVPAPLAALVPGDVNDDLARAGLLPDPLFATNSVAARWVMREPWTYSASFATPPAVAAACSAAGSVVLLRFEGVDYESSVVVLNCVALGGHVGSFEPFELDVSAALFSHTAAAGANGNNTLVSRSPRRPRRCKRTACLSTRGRPTALARPCGSPYWSNFEMGFGPPRLV